MKKLLLLSALVLTQNKFYSQAAVTNGTFETWSSVSYNEPNGWNTSNFRDIQRMGISTITKVTGVTGSAIRIQTVISGADTSDSYFINTGNPCSEPNQWVGGVPYSQQPTAITGKYRYNLPGSDSALLVVVFRKNGVHIGDNLITFKPSASQSTFASFSFPVTCSGVPDTIIIAAASSNKLSNTGVQNGSFLELDNLAFTGTGITQAIPNGTFDNWTAKSYDTPDNWEVYGESITKSTPGYTGNFAVRLETKYGNCNGSGANPSGITTGHMSQHNGPQGGTPYTLMSDSLCGYYKYTSMGGDSAIVYVSLTKNHLNVGGGYKKLSAAGSYTYFSVPFSSFSTAPDTMRIDIQSSGWNTSAANNGSALYIDNLYLKSNPVGILSLKNMDGGITLYPNPVNDVCALKFGSEYSNESKVISVYNSIGENVGTWKTGSGQFTIDTKLFPSGIYFVQVKTESSALITKKFVKE